MARIKLTKTVVDQLEPPAKGQAFVWDSVLPGFAVRLTASGGKAWVVQTKVRGGQGTPHDGRLLQQGPAG